jgi:hypothetical protein
LELVLNENTSENSCSCDVFGRIKISVLVALKILQWFGGNSRRLNKVSQFFQWGSIGES